MKPSKSISSLVSQQQRQPSPPSQQQHTNNNINNYLQNGRRLPPEPPKSTQSVSNNNKNGGAPTSPICRCRVMYLGSSVPHITKDGLQGIQEPLRELYPDKASLASGNAGIDSWLSVWSNGILIENVDDTGREVKRFFKIDALHYCAAVKYVPEVGANQQTNGVPNSHLPNGGASSVSLPKFLPLDSPHARMQQNNSNPPIFASILRRTTGVKVLECHAFICKREAAANALVRCCFHAYADTMYAKQIGADVDEISNDINNNNTSVNNKPLTRQSTLKSHHEAGDQQRTNNEPPSIAARRSKSIAALNNASDMHGMNGDMSNHQANEQLNYSNTLQQRRSNQIDNGYTLNGDLSDASFRQHQSTNLLKQQKLSKSLHHLHQQQQDQIDRIYGRPGDLNPSTSFHNLSRARWNQQHHQDHLSGFTNQQMLPPQQPFFTPEASRVPSYPPQNLIDQQANNSGTLRSIKSVAGHSIASTLLRSKKHAKAMSMAQMNHQNSLNPITSFHQPYSDASTTLCSGGSFLMPPIPAMFLPNMPRPLINGSQTMKLPSKHLLPMPGAPMNFESMTPKEMKKLLKKSAKYGIDPNRFSDNGLPLLPLRPIPLPPMPGCHPLMSPAMHGPPNNQPPPPPPPPQGNKSGTIGGRSMFSMDLHSQQQGHDMPDMRGIPMGPPGHGQMLDAIGMDQPIKSILVKPNPEFLKSKAGKKWLKQQKEFKKLLPPHLDGLPIVFGPPPMDALEPAAPMSSANNGQQPQFLAPPPPPPPPHHPGLPIMDSSGFYNPHPFYGPSGRASAASTLLRYSPHSQMMLDNGANMELADYAHRSQTLYGNPLMSPHSIIHSQNGPFGPMGDDASLVYGNNEMGTFDRQFATFNGTGHGHHQNRNHMVEQSVISLGDENDLEDEERDNNNINNDDDDDDDDDGRGGQSNGYYNRVDSSQQSRSRGYESSSKSRRNNEQQQQQHIMALRNQMDNQQDYEQVMMAPANDDQSSHSSGIYRRGHMNERAFSYSIRQEHKSSGGSDAEYTSESGNHLSAASHTGHHNPDHHQIVYDNPHTGDMYNNACDQYSYNNNNNRNQSNNLPVNELAARIENQLNMKSFANSRVKSHM